MFETFYIEKFSTLEKLAFEVLQEKGGILRAFLNFILFFCWLQFNITHAK